MAEGLALEAISRSYSSGPPWARKRFLAVESVNLTLEPGSATGLVGESGSGKSTLARIAVGLDRASSGKVLLDGTPVPAADRKTRLAQQRAIQIVFQDPKESLNPRQQIGDIIAEGIRIHGLERGSTIRREVLRLLEVTGLPANAIDRFPQALSGGQRQRVGIARALAVRPRYLIADEPVSALDLSVQAQIINLLDDLRREFNLGLLFISHDLEVVEHVVDQVAVMFRGNIVEFADTSIFRGQPAHPYTQALKRATSGIQRSVSAQLAADPTIDDSDSGIGCSYRHLCPVAIADCGSRKPPLKPLNSQHSVSCHVAASAKTS